MTRGEPREEGRGAGRVAVLALACSLGACLLSYPAAYLHARATHRLVHYAGGFVARPNALHGLGFSTEELVFAPAIVVEETVRGALDPTWSW